MYVCVCDLDRDSLGLVFFFFVDCIYIDDFALQPHSNGNHSGTSRRIFHSLRGKNDARERAHTHTRFLTIYRNVQHIH